MSFADIKNYKGQNIDIIGRAIPQGVYSRGQPGNKEIILKDYDGTEIAAVTFHFIEKTLWKGLGSKIDFAKMPIVAIKSIFVKEYLKNLCLASHDDTQIIAEEEKIEVKEAPKPKPTSDPPVTVQRDLRNYRVSCA